MQNISGDNTLENNMFLAQLPKDLTSNLCILWLVPLKIERKQANKLDK
jgi:hypothetical protein